MLRVVWGFIFLALSFRSSPRRSQVTPRLPPATPCEFVEELQCLFRFIRLFRFICSVFFVATTACERFTRMVIPGLNMQKSTLKVLES